MNSKPIKKELTDDEAALYDRQIRPLWGVEAQKRINTANVLVVGMSGVGAEVCKNIILSGVNSLTMLDGNNVQESDFLSNFFLNKDSIGQNRAASSLERAKLLNPNVEVTAVQLSPELLNESFYSKFNAICALGCTVSQIKYLNKISRALKIYFYAAHVFGMTSYIFVDLGNIQLSEKQVPPGQVSGEDDDVKPSKIATTFFSFEEMMKMNWSHATTRILKKATPTIHSIMILLDFMENFKRSPKSPYDLDEIYKIIDKYSAVNSIPIESLVVDFPTIVFGESSPVCAITGGVLAQEIVKGISQIDEPISNLFIYDTVSGLGVVEVNCPAPDSFSSMESNSNGQKVKKTIDKYLALCSDPPMKFMKSIDSEISSIMIMANSGKAIGDHEKKIRDRLFKLISLLSARELANVKRIFELEKENEQLKEQHEQ